MFHRFSPIAILIAAFAASACSSAPALTDRDRLIVADVVNTTGDPVFDDGPRAAVAVELQQSPFLTLLSDPGVQRALRSMQRPANEPVTGQVARDLCKAAGGTVVVEGSIAAAGSNIVITLTAKNCQSGASLAKQEGRASGKDDVVNQIGVLVRSLRHDFGEPADSISKYDQPATQATTASLEALRAYGQGLRVRATRGDEAAVPLFQQAVALDPGFAIAYTKLGVVMSNVGRIDEATEDAKKAYELRGKATEYERLYIDWNYAARVLQDRKAVKASLEALTTTYPRDFAARNNFGVYFNGEGELEESLKQYRAASDIAPDEPGPISNAAYVLLALGRFDEASEAADRALAIRPEPALATTLWVTARVAGDPRAPAFEQVARGLTGPEQFSLAEASLASWFGQFQAFEKMQNALIARAENSGNPDLGRGVALGRMITLAAYRQGRDLAALRAAAAGEKNPALLTQEVSALAMLGDVDAARSGLKRLAADAKADPSLGPAAAVARAYVQAKDGQAAAAIASLQAVLASAPRARDFNAFIGDLRAASGDIDGAIASYRAVIDSFAYLGPNPLIPLSRLKLARLLIKRGDQNGAKEQLDALLKQWKDADTEFPALTETKQLRAQIKS